MIALDGEFLRRGWGYLIRFSFWSYAMRLCHTSDWHLGQQLHGYSREVEHRVFLDWLFQQLIADEVETLLISGDIFDHSNPPVHALHAWYGFLARIGRELPQMNVVAIGGNHDSAARLEAAQPLLTLNPRLHLVGGVPYGEAGELDLARTVVPLLNGKGESVAWCALLPFIRFADLPPIDASAAGDPLVEGVRHLYERVFTQVAQLNDDEQPVIAMGHCYLAGTVLSEMSERKVLGGNQHALPKDIFPSELAYVALGHLHRAQRVGGDDRVRYAGSPLPLALDEAAYPHQVLIVDVHDNGSLQVASRRTPRHVDMKRVGPAPIDRVLSELAQLPETGTQPPPFLEVRVTLAEPAPGLRRRVEAAVKDKYVRLVRLTVTAPSNHKALADREPQRGLEELRPEEVFAGCYARQFDQEPPDALRAMFAELLDAVGQGDA